MTPQTIVGRYEITINRVTVKRLRLAGPFSREIIDQVFLKHKPYSYCCNDNSGLASLLVGSERECVALVKILNSKLKDLGYQIDYRGKSAIPADQVESIKTLPDLYSLTTKTLIKEADGAIDLSTLVEVDGNILRPLLQ